MKECGVGGLMGIACRESKECAFEADIELAPPDLVEKIMTKPYEGKCPLYEECMKLRAEKIASIQK